MSLIICGGGFLIVALLSRLIAGAKYWKLLAAGILVAAGTVGPSVLSVFYYAVRADYAWAIRGPGHFAHLGSGPANLGVVAITFFTTILFWGTAIALCSIHEKGKGEQP